jgi:adenylate kinase
MHKNTNTIVLIGRPGSGKGTQAKLISENLGWLRLSSGDRIKEIRDGGEPFTSRVREMYDKGTLLPDWFADYLLESSLLEIDSYVGIVLEGFGRTPYQAKHLLEIVSWLERNLIVFNLDVSEEVVTQRMLKRAETEDRPDSNGEEKILARLKQYDEHTAPALAYFREQGNVIDIRGDQSAEKIAQDIADSLDPS